MTFINILQVSVGNQFPIWDAEVAEGPTAPHTEHLGSHTSHLGAQLDLCKCCIRSGFWFSRFPVPLPHHWLASHHVTCTDNSGHKPKLCMEYKPSPWQVGIRLILLFSLLITWQLKQTSWKKMHFLFPFHLLLQLCIDNLQVTFGQWHSTTWKQIFKYFDFYFPV